MCHKQLKSILMEGNDLFNLHGQYNTFTADDLVTLWVMASKAMAMT